jgi:hypothetical protein
MSKVNATQKGQVAQFCGIIAKKHSETPTGKKALELAAESGTAG